MSDVTIQATALFSRLLAAYCSGKYRYFVLQGGTWSGKTYAIMQLLYYILERSDYRQTAMVVSETYTHIKDGPLTDLMKITGMDKDSKDYNITDKELTVGVSNLLFRTADKPSKLKTSKKDIVYFNEANSLPYSVFKQGNYRARSVFIDFNPDRKFWAHDLIERPDCFFDISTYKDNEFTPQDIINNIESEKDTDPEWYRVYGLGQIGQHDAIVFKNWRVEDLSKKYEEIEELNFGLDFGFHPDPAAFVITGREGRTIYIFKSIALSNATNEQLAEVIKPWCNDSPVWCDSAEPKSIMELRGHGINAFGCGPKHRDYSIRWLSSHEIVIDDKATGAKKEIEEFSRLRDKSTDEVLPAFQKGGDHFIDASRYSFKVDIMQGGQSVKNLHIPGI